MMPAKAGCGFDTVSRRRCKQRRASRQLPETAGPAAPEFLADGLQHHRAGRLGQAEKLYLRVLQLDRNNPDALQLLGVLANQQGDPLQAVELISKALEVKPDYQQGDPLRAVELISKALEVKPDYAEAYCNLGIALAALGKISEAVIAYHQAIALNSEQAEPHHNLGNALVTLGRLDEAITAYRRAVALKPNYADAHQQSRQNTGDARQS
jgi:Flp pilus assembly protein TadD